MSGGTFWEDIFGNPHPVCVEIGSGRGEFLLASAHANPSRNFFGIERSRRRVEEIQRKLDSGGPSNARILLGDATCVIEMIPDACVTTYVIQFPDPWWKRRHHRRRILTERFVTALARTLVPAGTIELMTDVEEYFDMARGLLDAQSSLQDVSGESPREEWLTSFARKARTKNARIYVSTHRRRR